MRSKNFLFAALLLLLTFPRLAAAGLHTVYVAEFSVSGAAGRDELKVALPGLLASRLNQETLRLTDDRAAADLVITGSYTRLGGMYSIDLLLKGTDGKLLRKVYEQGEGDNDLFPALERLSRKIDAELARTAAAAPPVPVPPQQPTTAPSAAPVTTEGFRVLSAAKSQAAVTGWTSRLLDGALTGVAVGRRLPSGEREIFVAGERTVRHYLQKGDLKLVAEARLEMPARILGIDSADLDGDGIPELYVTAMDRETLASRVYQPRDGKLEMVAGNLPYFFRGMERDNGTRTIMVQEMGMDGDFYGPVAELARTGKTFTTRNPLKLPPDGNLYNYALIAGPQGSNAFVLLNEDGYLVVFAPDGKQLWKSSDRFGGTERHYTREAAEEKRFGADPKRWVFLEQRLTATPDGELLVPRNDGTVVVGNLRSYGKHSLSALHWTGAILEETWHSRESPTYLADYAYDPATRELTRLEVTRKANLLGPGSSILTVNAIGKNAN